MYKINCMNPIAQVGLEKFSEQYVKTENMEEADGILVRSASMHEMELSENLLAVARAGAGVNNIPLEKCAEAGVVVFNTPGANANGVKGAGAGGAFLGLPRYYRRHSLVQGKGRGAGDRQACGEGQKGVCRA